MNKKVITRAIGTRFIYNGFKLEVVENTLGSEGYCTGCFFDGYCIGENRKVGCRGCCSKHTRTDGKDVIFKLV